MKSWNEVVEFARKNSPFYNEFYKNLPMNPKQLSEVPILDVKKYWEASKSLDNRVLTGECKSGYTFRSGGTTGKPKYSIYSKKEWDGMAQECGKGLVAAGLSNGDRVANIGGVGDLSAGFVFHGQALASAPVETMVFPVGRNTPLDRLQDLIDNCNINVLMGTPSVISNYFIFFKNSFLNQKKMQVNKILFFGEHLFPQNELFLRSVQPDLKIGSASYSAVDAGIIGYSFGSRNLAEYRIYSDSVIVEIVDLETNEIIVEPGKKGRLLMTSLSRTFMPIIRYSIGDVCEWSEPEGNKDRSLILHNRVPEAWNISYVPLTYSDVEDVINQLELKIDKFQIYISKHDSLEKLTIRLGVDNPEIEQRHTNLVVEKFKFMLPKLAQLVELKHCLPISIEWLKPDQLDLNSRTGKLMRVIDDR